ncbi:choice-of-anchor P family protein [Actinosynnema sp. NPDC053489]|uniref:choice-of-anchor P family protein n=1 Tax=Actinosynnema sp. NPDC053489 TaxID=3363916 RepID=UPI0037CA14DF
MRLPMTRRAAVTGLVAAAALVLGAAPASAAPGDASALGARLTASPLGRDAVTAGPFAAASADGPTAATFAGADLPGVLRTGVITTSASRDDRTGGVGSWASTADVRLDLLATATGGLSAELVEAECAGTQKGVVGKATLTGLHLGRLGEVGAEPAPNTALDVDLLGVPVARVVLNEQVRDGDGSLTVNALHVTLLGGPLGSGDLVLSQATCGPASLPIPMASGAGLWAGLGLLALFGVPVAAAALRRRHGLTEV